MQLNNANILTTHIPPMSAEQIYADYASMGDPIEMRDAEWIASRLGGNHCEISVHANKANPLDAEAHPDAIRIFQATGRCAIAQERTQMDMQPGPIGVAEHIVNFLDTHTEVVIAEELDFTDQYFATTLGTPADQEERRMRDLAAREYTADLFGGAFGPAPDYEDHQIAGLEQTNDGQA